MSAYGRVFAHVFDRLAAREDRRGSLALRERVAAGARGDVLEIGAGTGRCFPLYRSARAVTAVEPDAELRRFAQRRAATCPVPARVLDGNAQALPFGDESFDTVVTTWVLCTVPSPRVALDEVRRVLRPGGAFRFVEHVRASDPDLARLQDRLATPWRWVARGCRCNQDTEALVRDAGFELRGADTFVFEATSPKIVRPTFIGEATWPGAGGSGPGRASSHDEAELLGHAEQGPSA